MLAPLRRLQTVLVESWHKVEFVLARRFALATREDRRFLLLIPIVGALVGAVAVMVQRSSELVRVALWGYWPTFVEAASRIPTWRAILAPLVGGAVIALLLWRSKERIAGRGVGSLIEAVALSGGKVATRPALLAALAAIVTVGSGGSLGREGPMLLLGAAIASELGRRAGLPPYRLKILVGCGTAAGFAAAFNVPIGGALFAMEVVLGSFALEIFGPIVVASVIATVLARAAESNAPIYPAPGYQLVSAWELLAYLGLGVVGAFASMLLTRGLRGAARAFDALGAVPVPLRAVLGMGAVGLLGVAAPEVLGNGFATITDALHEGLALRTLLFVAGAKLLATVITAGSGCPGGHTTPALCFGALLGGAYGHVLHLAVPELTATSGAYAAVGMAAIQAGTSHAPLSAILLLFELTGNYDLILPLMVATIVSTLLARHLSPYSMLTEGLQRRGIDLSFRLGDVAVTNLRVKDLAREDREVLQLADPVRAVVERFLASGRRRLFVVDAQGALAGAVTLADIQHAVADLDALSVVVAHDLMVPPEPFLAADDRLDRAAEAFGRTDYERLPVVADGSRELRGVLAKRDLLALYAQEVLGRPAMLSTFVASRGGGGSRDYVELPPDFRVRLIDVPRALAGRSLAAAALTRTGLRVLEIRRRHGAEEERFIPDADTVLAAGDRMTVLGPTAAVAALEGGKLPPEPASALATERLR